MLVVWIGCQILGAWLYGHIMEWVLHKHVLHRFGTSSSHILSFHFQEHHRNSRKNEFYDSIYERFRWDAGGKELLALWLLNIAHLPLITVAPWFVMTNMISSFHYHRIHKRAHLDPEWAKAHVPWHYDHHMGKNQHANWGVRSDVIDRVMGTRIVYTTVERR